MMDNIKKLLVNHNETIKETMRTIDRAGLGIAFIINNDKKLVGTATDGDIRRAILRGINLKQKIKEIMNKDPIIVKEKITEEKLKKFASDEKFRNRVPSGGSLKIPVLNNQGRIKDIAFVYEKEQKKYIAKQKPLGKDHIKNILVVGGAGYLGSVLCRELIKKKYNVRVLDNLTYGDHGIKEIYNNPNFKFINGDMRDIQTVMESVKNIDAVIHLAAIVGDPASALNPQETIEINYLGTKILAEICKYSQINRFIFASTCSVYGASRDPEKRINENSKLNPVSLYAEMKLKSEQGLLEIADDNFSPTILRMSTLYGLSPRMRFDLVVNTLSIKAIIDKKFTIFGGEQWRPNLHVKDAANAYIKCLEEPINNIRGEIFNVGSDNQNYKIIEIGEIIKNIIPEADMRIDKKKIDIRNYNVSFDKINDIIKYKIEYEIEDGVKEIKKAVENNHFKDYNDKKYSNYKYLKESF